MNWQKLKSRVVYQNRFMTITDEKLLTDYGKEVAFGVVHKEPGVSIIPWDGKYLTLVQQYRYPVDEFSWEFPAGHYEHDSIDDSARAELREEAGLEASQLEKIGEFYLAPGHHTQVIHFYLAIGLHSVPQELEVAEEGMTIKRFTPKEINTMIKNGEIKDSLTIAAMKFFELHQQL
jgi:ADP-ribose pyrophosphatase